MSSECLWRFVFFRRFSIKWYEKRSFMKQSRHWVEGVIIGLTKAIIIHLHEAFVPVVCVCVCACAHVCTRVSYYHAHCGEQCQCWVFPVSFVWPAWQNPAERESERASERGREGKRPLNNVLIVSFHNTASSVQPTGTAVWSTAPKEQLGTTLRLCVAAEAFSLTSPRLQNLHVHNVHIYIFLAIASVTTGKRNLRAEYQSKCWKII